MGFFGELGCFIGLHDWTTWKYIEDGACEQTRKCKRPGCNKIAKQVDHSWSDWSYERADDCTQVRHCERCDDLECQIRHVWDVWQYKSPTSCDQVKCCLRCNETEVKAAISLIDHQLAPTDLPRMSCTKRMGMCKRCGQPVTYDMWLAPEHNWGPWERSFGNKAVRRCRDCSAKEEGAIN